MARAVASVSKDLPRLMLEFASRSGIGLEGASERDFSGPGRAPMGAVDALWARLRAASGDPALALLFGRFAADAMGGHVLFAVMRNSATVGEALERFRRYHGLLADGAAPLIREERAGILLFADPGSGLGRHYAEAVIATLFRVVDRLSGGKARPLEARFSGPRPPDASAYERILGAPARFGAAEDAMLLSREDAGLPVSLADPGLLEWLERFASSSLALSGEARSWTERAGAALRRLLLSGSAPSLGGAARELGVSPRQLQRRLGEEGSSLRLALDGARAALARELLERGGTELCDIAFLLGFSEQSAFNRAFKRWTGAAPRAYARLKRQGGGS